MIKLDGYEAYLDDAGSVLVKDARDNMKDHESLHRMFSEEIDDEKLLSTVNRILRQDGQAPLEKLTAFDVVEVRMALQSRLKCRECDPEYCDGWIYKLTQRGDGIVGSWVFCKKKEKYELIKRMEKEGVAEKIKRQLGVESLWELSLKQLWAAMSED